jgi:hypothetical protein
MEVEEAKASSGLTTEDKSKKIASQGCRAAQRGRKWTVFCWRL